MGKIYFYKTDEPYGEFSNFSNHPIYLDGVYWATVEHYFQSNKFFNNHHMTVQLAKTPFEAAQLGRSRAFPIRPDWEAIKDEVMKKGVFKKIEMHASVRELLLGTGELEIVEHTENDFYWGDGGDGSGLNKFGKILME
ncbi:MAG TPA: NADAR domain-containing protein, partial [Cellvibrionaceae bacterium]|nr:NADAR domain-containing protein [Cellvibrionaceae bacterium]